MLEEVLDDQIPDEIRWFGAKLKVYNDSEEIQIKSESIVRQQSYFVNELMAQNIQFIKSGHLRARKVDLMNGATEWKLVEKGVDVGLAVEMTRLAKMGVEVVIVTADTDLLPAFDAVRAGGGKLLHVGYSHRELIALSRASDSSRLITSELAAKYRA